MDIRFVNSNNEIINATNLSIKADNRFLIGSNERAEITIIEIYESGKESQEVLKKIADELVNMEESKEEIIIDLRRKKE